jgi:hypothetical protein
MRTEAEAAAAKVKEGEIKYANVLRDRSAGHGLGCWYCAWWWQCNLQLSVSGKKKRPVAAVAGIDGFLGFYLLLLLHGRSVGRSDSPSRLSEHVVPISPSFSPPPPSLPAAAAVAVHLRAWWVERLQFCINHLTILCPALGLKLTTAVKVVPQLDVRPCDLATLPLLLFLLATRPLEK